MPTLQVVTLGCSKNTVDTEHLLYQVRNSYEIVPEEEVRPVDVQLINTCGFIGDAKEQSVQAILASVQRKKEGEIGRLLVFGCLSQRYPHELPDLIPEVDGWFGARDLDPVVRALGCKPDPASAHRRVRTDGMHPYAYLKISEGCDRRCSYCAIPHIRGPHRSVPMETLVKEAEELAAQGVRELVIIAQDTTYYGLDLYKKRSLAELLRRLSAVDGIEWLRIHYSYPADFPEDVLDEMAENPKVCRYMDKIISNLLQNAIDEVSTHEDKSYGIHLTILKRGEFCVIRTSNKLKRVPGSEELGQIYQQGYTTKRGHDGVGLSSVRTLLTRYHGTIYTQLEEDVIHFVARVPINYAKEVIT